MKVYFNNDERPEQSKIYLGTPNNKVLCALNGVVEDSVSLTPRLNNNYELSFDVDKNILNDEDEFIESNGYEWLDVKMRVYLDTIGWFICDSPVIHNDGTREYKTINAYSCEIEMLQHDIVNLKINCGTTDSYEMLVEDNVEIIDEVEFAKEFITFYNRENPELSFLDIVLKVSGIHGWTIGYIDDIPKEYKYYENGELKTKYVSLSKEKGTFTIEAQDLYSFLTQDVAQYFSCVFLFDFKHMKINVYRPENLGKNTNINIGFRNLQNSNEISVNDADIFTTYTVYGSDELSIGYVNFGKHTIENIEHFLNEKYLSGDLIKKYKLWLEDVEYYRPKYIEYTRLYNEQLDVISELRNRLPLDDCSTDWSTFPDEKLLEVKANYEAQLKGYESFYVDENGDFDQEALDSSVDANDYYQIKDVILPSIQIEMDNRLLDDEDDYTEYIDSYETNWVLYGLDELQVKLDTYKNTVKVCELKNYNISYDEYQSMIESDPEKYSSHTEIYHTKMYEKYLEAATQLNADNPESCQYAFNERQKEVDSATALLDSYNEERQKIVGYVEKETWHHQISTSIASVDEDGVLSVSGQNLSVVENILIADSAPHVDIHGVLSFDYDFYFTEQDLSDLSKLYIDGEYVNENMFLLSSDTAVSTIDEQLKLLDAARDDLYISSHPQYVYSCDLDNFLAQYEYKNYSDNLELGDYIWLGVRDDKVVKLRLISMTYNPMVMDNNLSIEFSNMVKSRASRDDFSFLLGSATSRGKKSSSGSGNGYISNEGITLTPGLIQKLVSNGSFKNMIGDIIGDTVENEIMDNDEIIEYLQSELIVADTIVAEDASFKELKALVAQIDNLIAGNVSAELGHLIHITAENAIFDEAVILKLLAGELTAGTINTDKLNLESEDGSFSIVGNTMQFKDENNTVRIQIGKDNTGNFTFTLYDESGEGILLDSTGIHESAIADGLIKTDMYADKSVTVSKIDETGIYEWEDADGNKVMNVANMYYGDDKFEVSYTQLKEDVDTTIQNVAELKTTLGMIELSGEQFFVKSKEVITPGSITLTAVCRNGAEIGGWYVDGIENTEYVSEDLSNITIPSSFMQNKEKATIKVVDVTNKLYDEMTIYLLEEIEGAQGESGADGKDGESAYTIILENENITFVTDYDTNLCIEDTSYSCGIMVFKGIEEQTDYTIDNLVYDNGITAQSLGDTIVITVLEGTEITAQSGNITVPILIDGIQFNKNIVWNRVTTGKPGKDGESLTILGSYKTEEELLAAHPTGNAGEAYMVDGYLYVWDSEQNKWVNVGRIQGDPTYNIVLSNESQNIPCTSTGLVLDDILLTINYDFYAGLEKVAASAEIVTAPLPTGMTLGINNNSMENASGTIVFNVARESTLDGLFTGDIDIRFKAENQVITKTFTWTKSLAGESGEITLHELEASDTVLAKNLDGIIEPKTITFNAYVRNSQKNEPQPYSGRFIVQESINGSDYTNVLTTDKNVSSVEYTLSSNDVTNVRCYLYKADSISKELDRITIPVLSNVDGIKNSLTTLTTQIGDVNTRVDGVELSIENKVSLDTMITVKNDETGETVSKSLESYIASHQIGLDGITSEVSNIKTDFGEDISTLQENVSTLEQDAEGFKLEVSKTYATTEDLNNGLNKKNKTFQTTPTAPYLKGDLWFRESENGETEIYQCVIGKAKGEEFSEADWIKATDYQTTSQVKSTIDQTAESIKARVESTEGKFTQLEQRVDSFETTVSDSMSGMQSQINQNSDAITSKVWSDDISSAITQTENKINATIVDKEQGLQSQIEANAEAIESKVSNEDMETAINQSAENITLSVSERLSDSRDFMGVRYIRDWLNGRAKILNEPDEGVETVEIIDTESTESTETIVESDISNKWVECMVLVGEKDIAAGIIPTCYDENLQEIPIENLNPGVYTDEMLLDIYEEDTNVSDDVETVDVISDIETTEEETENANTTPIPLEEQYIELNGKHCLQIDLGSVHYDIDSISIWHYYVDGDRYNHLLEVSADGENWNVLFDSDLAGSYAEIEDGRTYHFSNYAIDKTLSQLKIEQDNITLRVQDNATHFAELSVTTGGISSTVGNIQEKQSELSSAIDKSNADIKDVADDLKNNYTTINQTKEKIDFAVSNVDKKITAAVELTERGWKGKFAVLGMMGTNEDSEEDRKLQDETDTYIHMDGTGITVTGEIDQDQSEEDKNKVISTHMTRYGFFGRNMENKDVFWLDAQGCHTGRAYIDNGWETPGIKMIPIEYNKNGSLVNGVVYVKSGGAS